MEDELKQLEAQVAAQDAMLNLLKSGGAWQYRGSRSICARSRDSRSMGCGLPR